MLRGVNVGSNTKLPSKPDGGTHVLTGDAFFEYKNISFVGKPFPLEEADEHFARLAHWGLTLIRFLVTWEAIEHEGPGIYDEEYCEYVRQCCIKARAHGLYVFIDPHQDVWARMSGGSGAPGWTFEAVGMDPRHFDSTAAALVHNLHSNPLQYPDMIWPTNSYKFAAATMFVLFFAGNDFASGAMIQGRSAQDFLQQHYFGAITHLAQRLRDLENVIGYETFNEPQRTWIGIEDICAPMDPKIASLQYGLTPTLWQSILLASGHAQEVDIWERWTGGFRKAGCVKVEPDPNGIWLPGKSCIWRSSGVWGYDYGSGVGGKKSPTVLCPGHFYLNRDGRCKCVCGQWGNLQKGDNEAAECAVSDKEQSEKVDDTSNGASTAGPEAASMFEHAEEFDRRYLKPFFNRFAQEIRKVHSEAIVFVEPPPMDFVPPPFYQPDDLHNLVFAPHFYDGATLMTKTWRSWVTVDPSRRFESSMWSRAGIPPLHFGRDSVRRCLCDQIGKIVNDTWKRVGDVPIVIGEIGIPFDLDNRSAYRTKNYSKQIEAMDASLNACEHHLVGFTVWNYNSQNTHLYGDAWNTEDLSIFSRDDTVAGQDSIDNGGRALDAVVRPYAKAVAGTPLSHKFSLEKRTFTFTFTSTRSGESLFFLPVRHFPPAQTSIHVSDGEFDHIPDLQLLRWVHQHTSPQAVHILKVQRKG